MKSLSGLGFLFLLFLLPSSAYSYTGRIIFTGYIYQSPCVHNISTTSVTFSCRQGTQDAIKKIELSTSNSYLPLGLGTSSLKWVNSEHSRGELLIAYR